MIDDLREMVVRADQLQRLTDSVMRMLRYEIEQYVADCVQLVDRYDVDLGDIPPVYDVGKPDRQQACP